MESSEDDAGAATIASRRTSAREKDPGQSKDNIEEECSHDESSRLRTSSVTPAISDQNIDDCDRSPLSNDVETTEAILTMIDQFVDDPSPAKQCTLSADLDKTLADHTEEASEQETVSEKLENDDTPSITSMKSEDLSQMSMSTISDSILDSPFPIGSQYAGSPASESALMENEVLTQETNVTENVSPKEALSILESDIEKFNTTVIENVVAGCSRDSQSEVGTGVAEIVSVPENPITIDNSNEKESSVSINNPPAEESPIVTGSAIATEMETPTASEYMIVAESSTGLDNAVVSESAAMSDSVTVSQSSPTPQSELEETHPGPAERENSENMCDASSSLVDEDNSDCTQVNEASSSELETVKNISMLHESESSERTVKCVSSSDSRNNVRVEEPSCSERPARRKLVRPAPSDRRPMPSDQRSASCDRRPDTTVSSTVDSLTSNTGMAADSVTKHVSSSSDAISSKTKSSIYDRVNLKNTSEVSVCKAETSVSPNKRIKLIRNKILPLVSQKDNSSDIKPSEVETTSVSDATSEDVTAVAGTSMNCTYSSISQSVTEVDSEVQSRQDNVNSICDNKNTDSDNCKDNVNLSREENSKSIEESASNTVEMPILISEEIKNDIDHKKVEPLKLNLSACSPSKSSSISPKIAEVQNENINTKSCREGSPVVPKLTIKFGNRSESPIPKLTIKHLKPPSDEENESEPMLVPNVTKLNIKPIPRPTEKSNEVNPKSSSSEISESESSENDESTSTSDQASASDQSNMDTVPKVTIKLGKPGTDSEGQFYTEKSIPKLTIKTLQNEESENDESYLKMRLKICQSEDKQYDKVPKLTIKPLTKPESPKPLSPKLIIKPIKPPEPITVEETLEIKIDNPPIPKLKISHGALSPSLETKESVHVPKLTIKPIMKVDDTNKVPVVTKLNIKPIVKPEPEEESETPGDKFATISKLNIKPIRQNDYDKNEVPVVSKLNIKPIKNPEQEILLNEVNDSNEWNTDEEGTNIPVVTKLNIKPIVKPYENDSKSETENSSDENLDIPVVTKINIKPIVKPIYCEASIQDRLGLLNTPVKPLSPKMSDQSDATKISKVIKPVMKPAEEPSSHKVNDNSLPDNNSDIPVVAKLNIKPIVKPDTAIIQGTGGIEHDIKKPHIVMKINLKSMTDAVINDSILNAVNTVNSMKFNECNNLLDDITDVTKVKTDVERKESFETIRENCNSEGSLPVKKTEAKNICNKTEQSITLPNHDGKYNLERPNPQETLIGSSHFNKFPDFKQNCTLLKQLLEVKRSDSDLIKADNNSMKLNETTNVMKTDIIGPNENLSVSSVDKAIKLVNSVDETPVAATNEPLINPISLSDNSNSEINKSFNKINNPSIPEHCNKTDVEILNKSIDNAVIDENLRKPLEIITEKLTETSGQDSPRIILKINKTDHGTSAKIITEEPIETTDNSVALENSVHEVIESGKRRENHVNRRKQSFDNANLGKRLRSSKVIDDLVPVSKKILVKRSSPVLNEKPTDASSEMSLLDAKRLKLGNLLSSAAISISKINKTAPEINHVSLHNDSSSKNGGSKLRTIFGIAANSDNATSGFGDVKSEVKAAFPETESNASTSSDVVEAPPSSTEIVMNDNSNCQVNYLDELSQDPLDVDDSKPGEILRVSPEKVPVMTPQPRKRGRPRKMPVSEGTKSVIPVPALEERPQRSLRLTRERPSILLSSRIRRGRGTRGRMSSESESLEESSTMYNNRDYIDPTSSRIKLPRLTEALNKCSTPLSSRRDTTEDEKDLAALDDMLSPDGYESPRGRGYRGRGRGSRGGRTPKAGRMRGRGRGGGRGAMYMKETMGIYGRVCGPSTTTVQLFEEETCMMDDNATPAKMAHLLDEDSQSSVKSSTNESSKYKKSKFAGLFDSSKVWTAADVKEYTWTDKGSSQVMMIQEQVAMFLEVKSFKRKYPELKRRTIAADERDYILSKGIVTEALCDLGITAVDAGEVLDIMLSDFPHKYEEYRTHQRERQLTDGDTTEIDESKGEETQKNEKLEVKVEIKVEKPEPPPEKTRQDMAAAAIASASEWNTRLNAIRRPACVDLQSMVIHERRTAPPAPRLHVMPPSGYYPHALLPGQFQHWYRPYTSEQLNCYPLNTVLSAPPPPVEPSDSSSDSEPEWGFGASSSDESDNERSCGAKRRKLVKKAPPRPAEPVKLEVVEAPEPTVDTCRTCGLREEANRKVSHERFLVCGNCQAKLHPSCLELSADTIRKCREYSWQCAECKACGSCAQPKDDDKMLFCDLCDRGFHYYCVGLDKVPSGRWHCVECAICKSCGARVPSGLSGPSDDSAEWHHHSKRGPGGHKVYSHSLCTPCARLR